MAVVKSKRAFRGRIRKQLRKLLALLKSIENYDAKELAAATAASRTAFRVRNWGTTSYVAEFNTVKTAATNAMNRKTTDIPPV